MAFLRCFQTLEQTLFLELNFAFFKIKINICRVLFIAELIFYQESSNERTRNKFPLASFSSRN